MSFLNMDVYFIRFINICFDKLQVEMIGMKYNACCEQHTHYMYFFVLCLSMWGYFVPPKSNCSSSFSIHGYSFFLFPVL